MKFECLNPQCPNYARAGVQLVRAELVPDVHGYYRCPACFSYVRVAPAKRPSETSAGVMLGAGGAVLGGVMFGPGGALLGGLLGLIVSSSSNR